MRDSTRWTAARRALIVACAHVTIACGGGSETAGPPSTPEPPPPPPPPPPLTSTTTGTTYVRSDIIAWPATPVPTQAVANATVALEGTTASSGADGRFSFTTNLVTPDDYKLMHVSAPGYIPSWYPWMTNESYDPKMMGMYQEVPVTPRPGFMKGAITNDAGGHFKPLYQRGLFPPTYQRAAQVGNNLIVLPDQQFIVAMDTAAGTVSMLSGGPPGTTWGEDIVGALPDLVSSAHSRGLQFMVWWLPYIEPTVAGGAGTFFAVPSTNTKFWDAVFAAWRPFILDRARIARDLGIEYIGLGFRGRSNIGPARFQSLIADIRAQGYTGQIFYLANAHVGGALELANADPAFLALWDGFVLRTTRMTTAPLGETAQTRERMRASLRTHLDKLTYIDKPLWLSVEIGSIHGGAVGGSIVGNEDIKKANAGQFQRDYAQQADAFMAAAEVINSTPVGNGRVMGLLHWSYWLSDNFYYSFQPGDAVMDKATNVRGKPAEAVLKWWFERW